MQAAYIARRFGVFLLIVWLAATLNFFLPRLGGQDPVRAKLLQQAALGGYVQGGIEEMTREYERRFGLDQPLWRQCLTYLGDVSRLDFNYSIANYPRTVGELIADAVPWTVGLLGTTTLLSFAIGTLLGALLAWPRAPPWMRWLMPPLWALHAIPFFLDRKSTRLNSSHMSISYAVFCLKKKNTKGDDEYVYERIAKGIHCELRADRSYNASELLQQYVSSLRVHTKAGHVVSVDAGLYSD